MTRIAAWRIESGTPVRLPQSEVQLERHLEGWIEAKPELIAGELQIVGRQVRLEGGRLDLLAVDPAGRWFVIEIKAGTLYRDVMTQALDYAACLSDLPLGELRHMVEGYLVNYGAADRKGNLARAFEAGDDAGTREVSVIAVGTAKDAALERVSHYLSGRFNVPIRVITFEVVNAAGGEQMLLREVTETAEAPKATASVEDVMALADQASVGEPMRALHEAAKRHGLYARPYKLSIMFTPPTNRTRMLLTAWARSGDAGVYSSAEAFSQFFDFSEGDVRRAIGRDGYRPLNDEVAAQIAQGLDELAASRDASSLDANPTPDERA